MSADPEYTIREADLSYGQRNLGLVACIQVRRADSAQMLVEALIFACGEVSIIAHPVRAEGPMILDPDYALPFLSKIADVGRRSCG